MDASSLALNIATLAISVAALFISRKAHHASEAANAPNIRFHLICHRFTTEVADLELITSNLSSKGNTLVKTRVALMDGPPALMRLRFREREVVARAVVELPPKELVKDLPFESEPVEPGRPIKSIGAKLTLYEFQPPVSIPGSSSIKSHVVFELPELLPEHAFDSLRVWVQARDVEGRLWEQLLILSEGVVESCHI